MVTSNMNDKREGKVQGMKKKESRSKGEESL